MPTLTKQQFEKMAATQMPPGMTKKGYLRTLVQQGYTLDGSQLGHGKVMEIAQRADEPGFLESVAKGLYTATQAPGNLMAGSIQKGIAGLARFVGAEGAAKTIESGPDVKNIGTSLRQTLDYAPMYGAVIGAGVGAPGLGSAAGQAAQEMGYNALGENKDTAFQQLGDIAFAGVGGSIAGANTTSILGTAGRSALGEAVVQGGKNLLGNQNLSLKQQAQSIGTAGLFGGGGAAVGKVAGAAMDGAATGGPRGAFQSAMTSAKDVQQELYAPYQKVVGMKLSKPVSSATIDADIDKTVQQALRPRTQSRGETKFTQSRYDENARMSMKDIAANREKITLLDADGVERPKGSLPQSLADLQNANDQMLKNIADRTNALHQLATGKGLTISTNGVITKLREFASQRVIQDRFPRLAEQAEALAARYESRGTYTPDDVQSIVAQANQELQAFQRNPNPNDIGLSVLSALEKNAWDEALSGTINSLTDNGVFKSLKRAYAAQKAIQGDVNFRLNVHQRQNPAGLIDHFAINTAADAAKALATFDPTFIASAVGQSAWRNWIKFKNNPDQMIKGLFKKLEQLDNPSILQEADEATARASILGRPQTQPAPFSPRPVDGEARTLELKGGQKGRPGIDRPASLPQPQAQTSVNGGSVGGVTNNSKSGERMTVYRGQSDTGVATHNKGAIQRNVDGGIYFTKDKAKASAFGDNVVDMPVTSENIVTMAERKSLQEMATTKVQNDMKNMIESDEVIEGMALNQPRAFAEYTKKPFLEAGGDWGATDEILYYRDFDTTATQSIAKSPKALPRDGATTGIPKELEPLAKEARKYKSAEEFVKSQPRVYHGSQSNLKSFSNKQGTFFTDDYMNADGYASGENVYEGVLNLKKPLIIDAKGRMHNDLISEYGSTTRDVVANVDSSKYDGVIFKNIKDSWIDDADVQDPSTIFYAFKPRDAFLNESQLTDLWKKANDSSPSN